jgi:hypothetical protein
VDHEATAFSGRVLSDYPGTSVGLEQTVTGALEAGAQPRQMYAVGLAHREFLVLTVRCFGRCYLYIFRDPTRPATQPNQVAQFFPADDGTESEYRYMPSEYSPSGMTPLWISLWIGPSGEQVPYVLRFGRGIYTPGPPGAPSPAAR